LSGYGSETFAEDLHKLLGELDLHDVVLAGMSMGGGEVARYLGRYGSERVSKAAIIFGVPRTRRSAMALRHGVTSCSAGGTKDRG
jgi:pimeloyl-ACP methyl ester carboxylesterase